jgi:uncharacterized membrane protein
MAVVSSGQNRRASFVYTPIDVAVPGAYWTGPFGINDAGVVVGYYAAPGQTCGFTWRRGETAQTSICIENATYTFAIGINNVGDVVGWYGTKDASGSKMHGFVLRGGVVTPIDGPSAACTTADGINDSGRIVGAFRSSCAPMSPTGPGLKGYLLSRDAHEEITIPDALWTFSRGINGRGDIVGYYADAFNVTHGFFLAKNSPSPQVIDFPGAAQTEATGINDHGEIVGRFKATNTSAQDWHGFLRTRFGEYYSVDVDFPGVVYTRARGINNAGQIVGDFQPATGGRRGFIAVPSQGRSW